MIEKSVFVFLFSELHKLFVKTVFLIY